MKMLDILPLLFSFAVRFRAFSSSRWYFVSDFSFCFSVRSSDSELSLIFDVPQSLEVWS